MSMFYYNEALKNFESKHQWDNALEYLECLYIENRNISVLASLIGFSWYYLIEGPVESGLYCEDANSTALTIWKKYIDIGKDKYASNATICFIMGYTLSLHGYYISEEYEKNGNFYMSRCATQSENLMLRTVAENFMINEHSRKHVKLRTKEFCSQLFNGGSLLDKYFCEIYCGGILD